MPHVFHGSSNSRTSFVLAMSEALLLGNVGFVVSPELAGAVVEVAARTLVCMVVESSVGAVAVSVDRFICDFVDTVDDEISCESLLLFEAELNIELFMVVVVVGSKEGLTSGLETALDTTRRKTSMKTIRGDIFATVN